MNSRDSKWMVYVLALTFGVVIFDRNAMGFLGPFVARDLALSNTQIGTLSSVLALTWACAAALVGALSDVMRRRKPLLVAAIVVFSLCSVGSGFAKGFASLLVSRVFMGLAEGGILPISQALVAHDASEQHRGRNAGIVQNAGSFLLGAFVAPLVLVAVASHFGWRMAFYLAALPGLACALLVARLVREPALPPREPVTPDAQSGAFVLFRYRNIWLCILISAFMVAWLVLGYVFLPLYYAEVCRFPAGTMGALTSVFGLSGAFFSFIVPGLSDRWGRRPVLVTACTLGCLVPLAALYAHGSTLLLAALVFLGWSASGSVPLFMAIVPFETLHGHRVGTAVGLVMGIGEITGGVLGPLAAGRLADSSGLAAALYLMGACALGAAIIALFLRETAPSKTPVGHAQALIV